MLGKDLLFKYVLVRCAMTAFAVLIVALRSRLLDPFLQVISK